MSPSVPTPDVPMVPVRRVTLERIVVEGFRNHRHTVLEPAPGLTCITGLNGSGKTNLLDAIYTLSLTRSRFVRQDQELICRTQPPKPDTPDSSNPDGPPPEGGFWRIAGRYLPDEPCGRPLDITLAYSPARGKRLRRNGQHIARLADHIGTLPVVMVHPDDTLLVRGPSEERRRFMDQMLCQGLPGYLRDLSAYNRLLDQRNALLAAWAQRPGRSGYILTADDELLLDTYDEPLLAYGRALGGARARATDELRGAFTDVYGWLSGGRERPTIDYEGFAGAPDEAGQAALLLGQARPRDRAAGRTTQGWHRDEFALGMDGAPARREGSQGQIKTFVLALKLASAMWIERQLGRRPQLLLDDIFERLDERRIQALLALVAQGSAQSPDTAGDEPRPPHGLALGQTIVTEATGDRLARQIARAGLSGQTGWLAL